MGNQIHNFEYYLTNIGIFVRNNIWGNSYNVPAYSNLPEKGLSSRKLNGISLDSVIFKNGYWHFPTETSIKSYEVMSGAGVKLVGFKLKNPHLESEKMPLEFSLDSLGTRSWNDDLDVYEYENSDFQEISSLYEEVYETIPATWSSVEFTTKIIGEYHIENLTDPVKMSIKGKTNSLNHTIWDLSTIASYSDIDRLLTPEFMIHERPCHLPSTVMYKIIRSWVKDNIDIKYAKITSDYDFCFAVSKTVKIKPFIVRKEVLTRGGNSYRPPKFTNTTSDQKSLVIFSMTHAGEKYGNYPVIPELRGNTLEDLANNLKTYLGELMYVINQPMKECEHCDGTGHVLIHAPSLPNAT